MISSRMCCCPRNSSRQATSHTMSGGKFEGTGLGLRRRELVITLREGADLRHFCALGLRLTPTQSKE
eukprot:620271-Prorocentrum_minimum.AAC.3